MTRSSSSVLVALLPLSRPVHRVHSESAKAAPFQAYEEPCDRCVPDFVHTP